MTTMFVAQQDKPPVIFELVAGPPTAPDELVAPALGNTTAKVALVPDKPEPKVQEKVETPPPPESVAPPKPKPDTSIVKELKKAEKMSYKDYLKKHPTPKPPATPPAQKN